GSHSEYEEQPDFLPDKFESGTLNVIGLAGLNASLEWIQSIGIEAIQTHGQILCQQLIDGLRSIPSIKVFGLLDANLQTAVVSLTIDGVDNAMAGNILDEDYDILCRIGLHCAPAAIKTINAFPNGTIRFSFGYFNNHDEVRAAIQAVQEITKRKK
ncbi:MAG: aminotransferase class V-fold PLP-dependent enzyme, partial [Anaerolineaceae bacterium]|nr:aminotransferase class V-fold PLP-dependent enzyme [Anaerolineaceae bacterium]